MGHLWRRNCLKQFPPGLYPDPTRGAYSAPQDSLAGGEGLAAPSQRIPPSLGLDLRALGCGRVLHPGWTLPTSVTD